MKKLCKNCYHYLENKDDGIALCYIWNRYLPRELPDDYYCNYFAWKKIKLEKSNKFSSKSEK